MNIKIIVDIAKSIYKDSGFEPEIDVNLRKTSIEEIIFTLKQSFADTNLQEYPTLTPLVRKELPKVLDCTVIYRAAKHRRTNIECTVCDWDNTKVVWFEYCRSKRAAKDMCIADTGSEIKWKRQSDGRLHSGPKAAYVYVLTPIIVL